MTAHARLRVGLDGRALQSPAAGIRRYTQQLLRSLVALREPLDLVVLGGHPNLRLPPGVERVAEPGHPPTNAGWMLVGLPLAARRAGVQVLHAPAYTAPFWSGVPTVLTIHDVSYARHPEWFPYRRDRLRRAFYRRCALSADLIVTDSAFSAEEIHAAYAITPERIVVVPLGVDPSFTPEDTREAPLPSGVSAPYVLHVGDIHERRNLGVAMRAVLDARQRGGALASLSLVLAGVDRGNASALTDLARGAGAPDAVVALGSVSEGPLRALYRGAVALVYPSLYEGFGLPLLEAMACGTPVLAARAASLPEVVGDAGLLLDPYTSEIWTDAIVRVSNDRTRAELRASGVRRAAQFTWAHTARMTLETYRRAVAQAR